MGKSNLHTAILEVMKEVKNIDKTMTVGSGNNSYGGVADKDVKWIIGQSMQKNGLTCLCIDIKPNIQVDRWDEVDPWSKEVPKATKRKQNVFTEIIATYTITHAESGESVNIVGYGHGVDSQDKSAGKATTYALKNALLYAFLVPTGSIDDTDKEHSNDKLVSPSVQKKKISNDRLDSALKTIEGGKYTIDQLIKDFDLDESQMQIVTKFKKS